MFGSVNGLGLMEVILLVVMIGVMVVVVEYWMGLEYWFFVVSEDVVVVYCVVLEWFLVCYIGLFGCLVGGVLIGELLVWFVREMLLMLGVVGLFCVGGDVCYGGDICYVVVVFNDVLLLYVDGILLIVEDLYYGEVDFYDLLVLLVFFDVVFV